MRLRIILYLWLTSLIFIHCSKLAQGPLNDPADVTTAATPDGSRLKAADVGPVRSALGQPQIDLNTFKLSITGLVDSSFSLGWEEIQHWPWIYTDTLIMYCVEGWEVWGNWKGILVKELLQKASLGKYATHVVFHGIDGYTTALPIGYLEYYDALLAYEVNGKPLKDQDGFPLRLIAFGKFGYKWAKWVKEIEVTDEPKKGYWESIGYSDQANVPLSRRKYYEGPDVQPIIY